MVLIDNMEMPETCKQCRFSTLEAEDGVLRPGTFEFKCFITRTTLDDKMLRSKAPDCPLKEVWRRNKRR